MPLKQTTLFSTFAMLVVFAATAFTAEPSDTTCSVHLTVTSKLPCPKIPMDPIIDFTSLIRQANMRGVLDPNSIEVIDVITGKAVRHALGPDFAYGDRGRVQWVIENPSHNEYDIRFRTAKKRPPLVPCKNTPIIGTGDLLRYNAHAPRPFPPMRGICRLVDLTDDGRRDLVGTGAYSYAPGQPFSGIFCYPRTGDENKFEFGDLLRVRYLEKHYSTDFKHFTPGYMSADIADLNNDKLPDVIFASAFKSSQKGGPFTDVHKYIHIYLNTGKRDAGGMPVFVLSERFDHPKDWWGPVRAVDLDNDGAMDFVLGSMYRDQQVVPDMGGYFIRNTNPKGWPIRPAKPVKLDFLKRPCFYDIDGDGLLDCVGTILDDQSISKRWENRVAWRKNLGGDSKNSGLPKFGPAKPLQDIDKKACTFVAAVSEGPRRGLLVTHDYIRATSFFEQLPNQDGKLRFVCRQLTSDSAVVADETNGCFPCDWDADGDWDILYGSCYGWIRIIINSGTSQKPVFEEPRLVHAAGKPIHLQMTKTFPDLKNYGHDLGYALPVFIDWDSDGLKDLMLPNLSNRIFWYKNIGTRSRPRFGEMSQLICDGYPENMKTLKAAARALSSGSKMPYDPTQPFWWRSRAAFGDLTGDGLTDMITADAKMTTKLFEQYRDASGSLRLREVGPVKLPDGNTIHSHIPPQYILVDWDRDGLLDLIFKRGSVYNTRPALARNIGTKNNPKFDTPVDLFCFGQSTDKPIGHLYYGIRDLDGDGKPDLLINTDMGTYAFYRHTALQMKERPRYKLGKPCVGHLSDQPNAPVTKIPLSRAEIVKLRKQAAGRKRGIVFHSDGMAMDPKKRFLEHSDCILPHLPGTKTDACTYSLIHQFPAVRLYRSKVGDEWPPGIIKKMYGDGPDGLEEYIAFCRENGYEAFWAMRTNDTHDAGGDSHGKRRWNSNKWKQDHQELLVGAKDRKPPYAQWTAFDYARSEVREKVFHVLEEVCTNYDIDGILLDFFRHPPTFKSTAWGDEAGNEERAMLSEMFARVRNMADEIGARRGRPILLAVRTPDSPGYCKALGLDIEHWMKEDLIDIWIASGYFRLQEWKETVVFGHKHGVQVWASMDEPRVQGRVNSRSLEAYRARIMNAWRAGVDAVWMFNFFYKPDQRQFKLLSEAHDIESLAHTDKLYVADARGQSCAGRYLKNGTRFFTRPKMFSPQSPTTLENNERLIVNLRVGDDLGSAGGKGLSPQVMLAIYASPGSGRGDLDVNFNGTRLEKYMSLSDPDYEKCWIALAVSPSLVKPGINRIEITRGSDSRAKPVLRDMQLLIKYKHAKSI
ncbi:MAG: VCBS repeat-containing protein [Pirellulales bacterium]|nr:VCBS repeat-containing protein [Pirellulales bacterium]